MKLKNGRVTVLFDGTSDDDTGMKIEFYDMDAEVTIATAVLNKEQTCKVLSRQGCVECDMEVYNLGTVGKQQEHKKFEFPVPNVDKIAAKKGCG